MTKELAQRILDASGDEFGELIHWDGDGYSVSLHCPVCGAQFRIDSLDQWQAREQQHTRDRDTAHLLSERDRAGIIASRLGLTRNARGEAYTGLDDPTQ